MHMLGVFSVQYATFYRNTHMHYGVSRVRLMFTRT